MGKSIIQTARGAIPADLVLKNGNVLNVFTEEIYPADVAIAGNVIVGVGEYKGDKEIDCTGKYIVPGFIDAHVHIESSMVTPVEFAKHIICAGTTGIIADPHEIVNVSGKKGLDFILDASENIPVNTYVMIPSSVPATDIDINGAGKFLAEDMLSYKSNPRVLGLGEMMRFIDVLNEQKETMDKLELFSDMIIDGHAPGITGKDVQAYRAAGVVDDHECATAEEGLEKLRAGFRILVREGSGAKNLESLLKGFLEAGVSLDQCMFCTDDKHLEDIEKEGHINTCIRKAIAIGVPAVKAYKMASFNTAKAYHIDNTGAIAPGHLADIVIVDDLNRAEPCLVIKSGTIVDKEWLAAFHCEVKDESLLQTVKVGNLNLKDLEFVRKEIDHVMELIPNQLLTLHKEERIPGDGGRFIPDSEYAKLVVAERHGKSGKVGVCPIKGYGIKNGAVATTVSHDSHNIIAVGDNDEDILCAINELKKIQGGYVIASGNHVVDELPLAIGGLMSVDEAAHVQEKTSKMVQIARNMGVKEGIDPFITLSFMALTVIPEIRLTESGIFDVTNMKFLT
ncbi:MAG: adenine deaminase [Muricomes sp.]